MATRIYIAGPITGHPDHKVAFARAAEAIDTGAAGRTLERWRAATVAAAARQRV